MAIVNKLGCGALGALTKKGTSEGEAERDSDNEAEINAKENAARSAVRQALMAAFKVSRLPCPIACPNKRLVITGGAPTTKGSEHAAAKGKWKCKAEARWQLKVQCFERPKELKGEATLPGTEANPVPLRCDVAVIQTGSGSGAVQAITPSSAAARAAKMKAEDNAFSQIEDTLKRFTCRGRCPERTITIAVGPPEITTGPNPTTDKDVWDKENMFDCDASCPWELTIECQRP
jgi:hypothetical protein